MTDRRRPVEVDWRKAADPDDLREYDAFGPWIDPVRTEIGMPRAFRPWYPEFADSAFLLKIPKDIDRASARPGQDLFAAVLAVGEAGVCQLRLAGGTVTREDATWDQVVACGTYTNLLLARWSLLLSNGSALHVPHNSVGSDLMAKVTAFVRTRIAAPSERSGQPDLPPVRVPQDYSASKLAELTRTFRAPVVAIHVEQKNRLCRSGRFGRRLSTGLMVVDTPDELVLVTGGEPTRSIFAANYATKVVVVPYSRLDSWTLTASSAGPDFRRLELRAGSQVIEQHCLDHPAAVIAALDGRAVLRLEPQGEVAGSAASGGLPRLR
ncbi:MAG TPA: hypothetical protein VGK17_23730 [Propionicimonas sp.]